MSRAHGYNPRDFRGGVHPPGGWHRRAARLALRGRVGESGAGRHRPPCSGSRSRRSSTPRVTNARVGARPLPLGRARPRDERRAHLRAHARIARSVADPRRAAIAQPGVRSRVPRAPTARSPAGIARSDPGIALPMGHMRADRKSDRPARNGDTRRSMKGSRTAKQGGDATTEPGAFPITQEPLPARGATAERTHFPWHA